jgi:hypothetical protein
LRDNNRIARAGAILTSNAYDLVIEGESYRKRLKPKSPALMQLTAGCATTIDGVDIRRADRAHAGPARTSASRRMNGGPTSLSYT